MTIGTYCFSDCTDEMLNEYCNKGELSLFQFGCGIPIEENDYNTTFSIYKISDSSDVVAFITLSFKANTLSIDEFEVVKSKQRNGIGKDIVRTIQNDNATSSIEVIPNSIAAKSFWRSCGFVEREDEYMIWNNT